jgi:hypothetical protein
MYRIPIRNVSVLSKVQVRQRIPHWIKVMGGDDF